MSYRVSRIQPEPPKKPRTGLIIGIVIGSIIVIAIIIVVIILLLRRNTTTTDTGGGGEGGTVTPPVATPECTSDTDCSGGEVCNTTTQLCVECLEDGDCSGGTPVCRVTNNTCVECLNDTHCSGGTPVCDVGSSTCVECNDDPDCPGAEVCTDNTCACPSLPPLPPTMLSASGGGFQFSASWTAVPGATAYRVRYENTSSGEFVEYCTSGTSVSGQTGAGCGGNIASPCLICPSGAQARVTATTNCGSTGFSAPIGVPDATCC